MHLSSPRHPVRLVLLVSTLLVMATLVLPSANAVTSSSGERVTQGSAQHRSAKAKTKAKKKRARPTTLRQCNHRYRSAKNRRACRHRVIVLRRHAAAVKRARARAAAVKAAKAAQAAHAGTVPVKPPTPPTTVPPDSAHFSLVGSEDFAGSALDPARWWVYDGKPGCCPDTVWTPKRVRVADGALQLWNQKDSSGNWLSGGVGAAWPAATRLYGRFETRLKFSKGAGSSAAALLWPVQGWPPEVDFYEIGTDWGNRAKMMMTTHWGSTSSAASPHRLSQEFLDGDFTQWHTVTVEWTPTRLDYFLDGRLVKSERDRAVIPHQVMRPAFQVHIERTSDGKLPTGYAENPTLSVDYLKVWKYNG